MRSSKFECSKRIIGSLFQTSGFEFRIYSVIGSFELVSDFDIRISDLFTDFCAEPKNLLLIQLELAGYPFLKTSSLVEAPLRRQKGKDQVHLRFQILRSAPMPNSV